MENKMVEKVITPEMVPALHEQAKQAAKTAVFDFIQDWTEKTGGNEYGEPMYCGFAWVELPEMKLSTKIGKAWEKVGFKKSWSRGLTLWDPAEHRGQSMDCKEIGAQAYADVLRAYGFRASMGSRAD